MKIRRYIGANVQEAILKVKLDLGNDALILNTRKVRQKGLFKLFAKPMVEVLAAVDEYYSTAKKEKEPAGGEAKREENGAKALVKGVFPDKDEKITKLEDKVKNMESVLQKIYTRMLAPEKEAAATEDRPREQPWVTADAGLSQPSRKALKDMPEILRKPLPNQVQHYMRAFYNNLIKNEVEADIAGKIIEAAMEKLREGADMNEAVSALCGLMAGLFGRPETLRLKESMKPTVAIFVGPTGVGKTTTLAKIAANFLLNYKKSVGLITADTYRIAAVEQLKIYAEILGIPISVIYSPAEIQEAIAAYSDRDLVLIDTAGRSHNNKQQFEELKSLVEHSGADEIYLVLSAVSSMRSMREILQNYSFLKEFKLIFTKIDEAPTTGIILNTRHITGKKLSYITNGQSVPDDIEIANTERLTKNLMGSLKG